MKKRKAVQDPKPKQFKSAKIPKVKLKDATQRVLQPLNRVDAHQVFVQQLKDTAANLRAVDYRIENGVVIID